MDAVELGVLLSFLALLVAVLTLLVTGLAGRERWLPQFLAMVSRWMAKPWRSDRRSGSAKRAIFELRVERELRWRRNIPEVTRSGPLQHHSYPREGGDRTFGPEDLDSYKRGVGNGTIDRTTTWWPPPRVEKLPLTPAARLKQLRELRLLEPDVTPPKESDAGPLPRA